MRYHVNIFASSGGDGSEARPFTSISDAAKIAMPGDEVLVYPGIYREAVDPINGGTESQPIIYRSVEKNKAVITGAEPLTGWVNVEGTVWSARVSNEIFTDRNPYTTLISGDWFNAQLTAHLGDVYLNGKSLYEVTDKAEVFDPKRSEKSWVPDFTVYVWFA